MKKVILSILMLLMSTVAMAQVPCETVAECETLRTNTHKLLTKKNSSPVVHESLDQQINQKIKILLLWPKENIIDGVQWSEVLPGICENLDLDKNKPPIDGIIQYSQATEACKAIGGRLPTLEDFAKFINNDDFLHLQERQDEWFWLSSVSSDYPNAACKFGFYKGGIDGAGYRDSKYLVRCIRC